MPVPLLSRIVTPAIVVLPAAERTRLALPPLITTDRAPEPAMWSDSSESSPWVSVYVPVGTLIVSALPASDNASRNVQSLGATHDLSSSWSTVVLTLNVAAAAVGASTSSAMPARTGPMATRAINAQGSWCKAQVASTDAWSNG